MRLWCSAHVCLFDHAVEGLQPFQRRDADLARELIEPGLCELLRRLGDFAWHQPGRNSVEVSKAVDPTKEGVVARKDVEQRRRVSSALALIRKQVTGQRVVKERASENGAGRRSLALEYAHYCRRVRHCQILRRPRACPASKRPVRLSARSVACTAALRAPPTIAV